MRLIDDGGEQSEIGNQHWDGDREHELLSFCGTIYSRSNSCEEGAVKKVSTDEIEQEIDNNEGDGNLIKLTDDHLRSLILCGHSRAGHCARINADHSKNIGGQKRHEHD